VALPAVDRLKERPKSLSGSSQVLSELERIGYGEPEPEQREQGKEKQQEEVIDYASHLFTSTCDGLAIGLKSTLEPSSPPLHRGH
jgi:hypothetical protein